MSGVRVVMDGLPLCVKSAGVGTYTEQLARGLAVAAPESRFVLFRPPLPRGRDIEPRSSNLTDLRTWRYPLVMGQPGRFTPTLLSLESVVGEVDLFHGTTFTVPARRRAPVVATVHDLTLLRRPELGTNRLVSMVRKAAGSLPGADRIIAVSETTRRDIVELCGVPPDRISVVYNGCSAEFRPRDRETCLAETEHHLQSKGPFLLHVGTVEPRKNLATLIRAFALLRRQTGLPHKLLLAGAPGWESQPLGAIAAEEGVAAEVLFAGFVPKRLLPSLYCAADVFVYPSLYEGFGLPVIEAMASGTPVVTSNLSALPEIAGGAALLVEPSDPEEIAAAIKLCLEDPSRAARLRSDGLARAEEFSWERTASQTLEVFKVTLGSSS